MNNWLIKSDRQSNPLFIDQPWWMKSSFDSSGKEWKFMMNAKQFDIIIGNICDFRLCPWLLRFLLPLWQQRYVSSQQLLPVTSQLESFMEIMNTQGSLPVWFAPPPHGAQPGLPWVAGLIHTYFMCEYSHYHHWLTVCLHICYLVIWHQFKGARQLLMVKLQCLSVWWCNYSIDCICTHWWWLHKQKIRVDM